MFKTKWFNCFFLTRAEIYIRKGGFCHFCTPFTKRKISSSHLFDGAIPQITLRPKEQCAKCSQWYARWSHQCVKHFAHILYWKPHLELVYCMPRFRFTQCSFYAWIFFQLGEIKYDPASQLLMNSYIEVIQWINKCKAHVYM